MAQHDYVIDNQASASARADLNSLFQAIASQNSGATAPTTTYANMIWYDTANDLLKMRNEANSAWITLGTLDQALNTFTAPSVNGKTVGTLTAAGGIAYATSTSALAAIGAGTAGQALLSGGAGAPTWGDITPTTAQVGTATAGLAAGAVGSYMFANTGNNVGDIAFGATRAGSFMYPSSAIWSVSGTASNVSLTNGTVQSGTWRAMGYFSYSVAIGGGGSIKGATLWLRIS